MISLELSHKLYEHCLPLMIRHLPWLIEKGAFGLAGPNPQCFGLAPLPEEASFINFSIWLPKNIMQAEYKAIARTISQFPQSFSGIPVKMTAAPDFTGLIAIEDFYAAFTGLQSPPVSRSQWLALDEQKLAAAVNGAVFTDESGKFSSWRNALLNFYPDDVWLEKLASRLLIMSRSGQRDLPRALRHNDAPAAWAACGQFCQAAISLVFLLNRRYMPEYGYACRLCLYLPILGEFLHYMLQALSYHPPRGKLDMNAAEIVEEFCIACAFRLHEAGISQEKDPWLLAHARSIIAQNEAACTEE